MDSQGYLQCNEKTQAKRKCNEDSRNMQAPNDEVENRPAETMGILPPSGHKTFCLPASANGTQTTRCEVPSPQRAEKPRKRFSMRTRKVDIAEYRRLEWDTKMSLTISAATVSSRQVLATKLAQPRHLCTYVHFSDVVHGSLTPNLRKDVAQDVRDR